VFDRVTLAVSLYLSLLSFTPLLLRYPSLIPPGMKDLACGFWGSIKYLGYSYVKKRTSRSSTLLKSLVVEPSCASLLSFSHVKPDCHSSHLKFSFRKFRYLVKLHILILTFDNLISFWFCESDFVVSVFVCSFFS